VSDTVIPSGLVTYIRRDIHKPLSRQPSFPPTRCAESHDADVVWLPAIFMGAFFQLPSRGSSQVMSTLNVFLLLTVSIAAFGLFAGYMLARR